MKVSGHIGVICLFVVHRPDEVIDAITKSEERENTAAPYQHLLSLRSPTSGFRAFDWLIRLIGYVLLLARV
jgi:hypothetical protein